MVDWCNRIDDYWDKIDDYWHKIDDYWHKLDDWRNGLLVPIERCSRCLFLLSHAINTVPVLLCYPFNLSMLPWFSFSLSLSLILMDHIHQQASLGVSIRMQSDHTLVHDVLSSFAERLADIQPQTYPKIAPYLDVENMVCTCVKTSVMNAQVQTRIKLPSVLFSLPVRFVFNKLFQPILTTIVVTWFH